MQSQFYGQRPELIKDVRNPFFRQVSSEHSNCRICTSTICYTLSNLKVIASVWSTMIPQQPLKKNFTPDSKDDPLVLIIGIYLHWEKQLLVLFTLGKAIIGIYLHSGKSNNSNSESSRSNKYRVMLRWN